MNQLILSTRLGGNDVLANQINFEKKIEFFLK